MRSHPFIGVLGLGLVTAAAPYTGNTTSREPEPEPPKETRQQRRYRERQERKHGDYHVVAQREERK